MIIDGNNTAIMEELINDVDIGTGNSPATHVRLENFTAMHEVGFAHGRYGGAG